MNIDRYLLLFFIILMTLNLCAGANTDLKISPLKSSLSFENGTDMLCSLYYVLPDINTRMDFLWTTSNPGELSKYNLSSKQAKVSVNYSRKEYGKYEICFQPLKTGEFYGIIFFQSDEKPIRIGSWIDLHVEKTNSLQQINLMTGKAVTLATETEIWLGIIFILLVIVFVLLINRLFPVFSFKNKHP